MKPVWTGSISFGLINIPVRLFSAVEDSSLDFDMLDSKDFSNIRYKKINEKTGREVEFNKIVKGYMLNGEYVILDSKDFEAADIVKTKLIEIFSFVFESEIDSIYYEQPYYLEPEKNGIKAYALLRDALKIQKKVGVSTFVLRNKEGLAIIKPLENVLVLNRIRFEQEIRNSKDLNLPPVTRVKSSKELSMAKSLIDNLTEKFNITNYKDTYSAKLLKIIKDKSKGKKVAPQKMKVVHSKQDDLMEMLKASLNQNKKKKVS